MIRAAIAVLVTAWALPALAEDLPEDPGAARSVAMFETFCMTFVPDLDSIAQIADEHFIPITGDALQRYQPEVPAEELKAWRFDDFESEFVIATARSIPDDTFKQEVPEFADSTNFSCSFHVPNDAIQTGLHEQMAEVRERPADESWEQAPFQVHAWAGTTETLMVNILVYEPLNGNPGGLLSVAVFQKN